MHFFKKLYFTKRGRCGRRPHNLGYPYPLGCFGTFSNATILLNTSIVNQNVMSPPLFREPPQYVLAAFFLLGKLLKNPEGGCTELVGGGLKVNFDQNWGCRWTSLIMEGKHCFTLFGGVTNFYQAILRVGEGHYFEKKNGSLAHSMYWSLSYLIRVDSMTKHAAKKSTCAREGFL